MDHRWYKQLNSRKCRVMILWGWKDIQNHQKHTIPLPTTTIIILRSQAYTALHKDGFEEPSHAKTPFIGTQYIAALVKRPRYSYSVKPKRWAVKDMPLSFCTRLTGFYPRRYLPPNVISSYLYSLLLSFISFLNWGQFLYRRNLINHKNDIRETKQRRQSQALISYIEEVMKWH